MSIISLLSATAVNANSTYAEFVTFPAGSKVTQHPVQHVSDYFRMFDVTHGWEEPETLQDENLSLFEWDFIIPRRLMSAISVREGDFIASLKWMSTFVIG